MVFICSASEYRYYIFFLFFNVSEIDFWDAIAITLFVKHFVKLYRMFYLLFLQCFWSRKWFRCYLYFYIW